MNGREGLMRLNYHPLKQELPGCCAFCPRTDTGAPFSRRSNPLVASVSPGLSSLHGRHLLIAGERGDRLHGDGVVGLHDVDEGCGAIVLHGSGRNQGDALQSVDQQAGVHELVGEQSQILIGKLGAEFDRPGGGVHLVIERDQLAGVENLVVGTVEGIHAQLASGFQLRLDLGQTVLRNVEYHRDGLQLRDHHEDGAAAGEDRVAGVHQAQAQPGR